MHGIVVTLLAGFSAVAVAQSLGDLPTCAQGCVGASVSVPGCNSIDVACICRNSDYLSGLSCCLLDACEPADLQAAVAFASSLCSGVGVKVPDQVLCSTASPSATDAATTSSASETSTETSATTATTTQTTPVTSGVALPTGTGGVSPTGTGNTTSVVGPTPSVPAGNGAASIQLGAGLGLAGMAAVVMAVL